MGDISRREFLKFVGGSTVVSFGACCAPFALAANGLPFTPVRLPHPLAIYTTSPSWLASGIGTGHTDPATASPELPFYTVIDDVIVPPEYERYVLLAWGDRPFPNLGDYVGYNHDFTAYVPLAGTNDGLLFVNHEYTSYPFSVYSTGDAGLQAQGDTFSSAIGFALPALPAGGFSALSAADQRLVLGESLYNTGGSVVRIRRLTRGGRFAVVAGDALNRRIHGLSGLGINSSRGGGLPTAWGAQPHQIGDTNYLIGTGPAATDVFTNVNADGLGNQIIGTFANCSGGQTPWGTVLSAEENFQVFGSIGVQENVNPNGTQTGFPTGITTASTFGMNGEKYGWMVEIDPRNTSVRAKKHTALGRYRHENMAMRVEAGRKLVAYLGDDRRGGHVWKFVSDGVVASPTSAANSALLESGTLYVAKFNGDGSGTWIPLRLSTPSNPNIPSQLGSAELAGRGTIDRSANTRYPRRTGLAGQTASGGNILVGVTADTAAGRLAESVLADYQGKTLADFYASQGAVLCDAPLAANVVGGTPCARPEDIEVHPASKHVYIAMTDGVSGGDGYPDSRVFQVGKYTAAINAKQPPGGLYRIIEGLADGAGTTFNWSIFAVGGEEGAVDGMGFAAVDNLAFDNRLNLWGVIDMSTEQHNGFSEGSNPQPQVITHTTTAPGGSVTAAGASSLFGIYGNNFMFYIPTTAGDPNAGRVLPFAIGPTRSEMTGPTFVGDHLLLSIQHPGENSPIGAQPPLNRNIEILNLEGTAVFNQNRTVPRGSAWPSNIPPSEGGSGDASGLPKPAVIGIRRKDGGPLTS